MPSTRATPRTPLDDPRRDRRASLDDRPQARPSEPGLRRSAAHFALAAALGGLAGCSDTPATPRLGDSSGLFAGSLSRDYPVAGALSAHAPIGELPSGIARGPEGLEGASQLSSSPLMDGVPGVTPQRLADPTAPRRMGAKVPLTDAAPTADPAARFAPEDGGPQSVVTSGASLVWQNVATGERSLWTMNGATWGGQFAVLPTVSAQWQIAASADFSGDGKPDLVWQNTSTGERSIWIMSGSSWAGQYVLLPTVAPEWSIAGAGDFNGDGKPDLVWQNTTTGDRSVWFMSGTSWSGSYALLPNVPRVWSIAAVDDFNADNKPDLVWQNTSTGERSVWFMSGATWTGSYALLPTVPPSWSIAGAADFNSDGKSDLIWQNTSTGERSIWLMNGATWTGNYALLPTIPTAWRIVGAGNFATSVNPPAAPTMTQPTNWIAASPTQLTVSWTRSASANETDSRIERALWSNGVFSQVGSVAAGVTAFTDVGLAAGTGYEYRVRSCNSGGCSAYSATSAYLETGPSSVTTTLSGASQTNLSGAAGTTRWYSIAVPAGASALTVSLAGGTGDADLNVYQGGPTGAFMCSSVNSGTSESCTVNAPAAATYYLRVFAFATYSGVTLTASYPAAPVPTTQGATGVTTTSFQATGLVSPNGLATTVWVEYGTSPTLLGFLQTGAVSVGSSFTPVPFTSGVITGLTGGTAYYYRLVANNALGVVRGAIQSVSTLAQAVANGVPLQGLSNPIDGTSRFYSIAVPTGQSWLYASTDNAGTGDVDIYVHYGSPSGSIVASSSRVGNFDQAVVYAPAAGTYYIELHAFAAYAGVTFTPFYSAALPYVATLTYTTLGQTSFTPRGTVNPNGLATTAWVEYSTSPTLATFAQTAAASLGSGSTDLSFQPGLVGGLSPGTAYYYRIVASNSTGVARGAIVQVITLP